MKNPLNKLLFSCIHKFHIQSTIDFPSAIPKTQKMSSNSSSTIPPLSLPLQTRLKMAVLDFITNRTLRPDGTIDRRLINFFEFPIPPSPSSPTVSSHDITVSSSRNLWFRLFVPKSSDNNNVANSLPVVVFFHGGGFSLLSPASRVYDAVCKRFVRRLGAVVVSVNYRHTPEHKFPSQYDDGFDVLRFLEEKRDEIECWPKEADLGKCFLAGDSAGGNLTHHVGVRFCQQRDKFNDLNLLGLIVIQPFFGGKETAESEIRLEGAPVVSLARTKWMWKAFLPDGLDSDHWAVNVSGPNAMDLTGLDLPPVILFSGGFDPLRDWQLRYGEWLKKSGKEVTVIDFPTVPHAFYVFPEIPESLELVLEVRDFIQKQCSKV